MSSIAETIIYFLEKLKPHTFKQQSQCEWPTMLSQNDCHLVFTSRAGNFLTLKTSIKEFKLFSTQIQKDSSSDYIVTSTIELIL